MPQTSPQIDLRSSSPYSALQPKPYPGGAGSQGGQTHKVGEMGVLRQQAASFRAQCLGCAGYGFGVAGSIPVDHNVFVGAMLEGL